MSTSHGGSSFSGTERDILYKLFFDLKKDMNDMKQMMLELAHRQGYSAPAVISENLLPAYSPSPEPVNLAAASYNGNTPIYMPNERMDQHEDVEESLMLADREKEFITKALKKHKGRRRDAANELGISERTLYRKIKEYDIKE
jgi:transcriptional regulator with PAS, ATPase and Fis domain